MGTSCCRPKDETAEPIVGTEEKQPEGTKSPDKDKSGYGALGTSPPLSYSGSEAAEKGSEEKEDDDSGTGSPRETPIEVAKAEEVETNIRAPVHEEDDDEAESESQTLLKTEPSPKTEKKASKKISVSVLLMGPSGVGKTCLIDRMILGKDYEFDSERDSTMGTRLSRCTVELPGFVTGGFAAPPVEVSVWDVGGMTMSAAVMRTTLRKKDVILWVYEHGNAQSAHDLRERIQSAVRMMKEDQYMMLIGNKSDLEAGERFGEELKPLLETAKEQGMEHYVVSAKEGLESHSLFFRVCFEAASRKYGVEALKEAGGSPQYVTDM